MSQWHHKFKRSKKERARLYERILFRDKGICLLCKKDNELLLDIIRGLDTGGRSRLAELNSISERRLIQSIEAVRGRLWDMDHIKPLADHGSLQIENIRTLCIECHGWISKIYWYGLKGRDLPKDVLEWKSQFQNLL